MTSLMAELHAVRGDDGGCGRGVTRPVVEDVEADGVVLDGRGEVDDGAADDDGAQEQNH